MIFLAGRPRQDHAVATANAPRNLTVSLGQLGDPDPAHRDGHDVAERLAAPLANF
jgi:hypothetical protein